MPKRRRSLLLAVLTTAAVIVGGGGSAQAFSVSAPCVLGVGDVYGPPGLVNLISAANALPGADSIDLPSGRVYTLSSVNTTTSNGPDGLPSTSGPLTIRRRQRRRRLDRAERRVLDADGATKLGGGIYNALGGTVTFTGTKNSVMSNKAQNTKPAGGGI